MQRMLNKISYNPGTEPTLNHATSTVSNLNCFRLMFFRQTLLPNISYCFCEWLRVKRARFLCLLNVLLVLSVSRPKLPLGHCCHQMMSSSANYRPFLSSFRHILPSGAFCQVSKLTIQTEHGCLWEMFIWSKLGQTPLEMHIRTFARIKNVT